MASQPMSRKVVEEYSGAQVERVMELWDKTDEFRKTYVKDNERSAVRRLETSDGRVLGPDEKLPEVSSSDCPTPSERSQSQPSVTVTTQSRHQDGIEVEEKVNAPVTKERSKAVPNVEILPVVEMSLSEVEQEAAELKEKRRADEMAKAKEAEDRKKQAELKEKRRADEMASAKEAEDRKKQAELKEKRRAEEMAKAKEAEERKKQAELKEKRAAEMAKAKEAEERKKQAELKEKRAAEMAKAKEAEERKKQEAEERKKQEAEERKKQEREKQEREKQEAAELKEKRRAEEMTKAKQAEERKKRAETRAQSRALARAQKEAEKKEKKKERRALQKSAVASSGEPSSVAEASIGVESNPEVEEVIVERKKVRIDPRTRQLIRKQNAEKAALKAAEKIPPARRGRRKPKVLGLPVSSLMGLGALAIAVLVAIATFMIKP